MLLYAININMDYLIWTIKCLSSTGVCCANGATSTHPALNRCL